MSEFSPTPADEYPIVREQEMELPSGARVIVRRPSMFMMLRRGLVPAEVRSIVEKLDAKEQVSEAETFTLLDCLVAASYVVPRVTFKRKKGALCIEDIPDDDRMAIVKNLGLRKVL